MLNKPARQKHAYGRSEVSCWGGTARKWIHASSLGPCVLLVLSQQLAATAELFGSHVCMHICFLPVITSSLGVFLSCDLLSRLRGVVMVVCSVCAHKLVLSLVLVWPPVTQLVCLANPGSHVEGVGLL